MSDWLAWQIVDSAFPVGVFAHSWGLEAAWQAGHVDGEAALRRFVGESIQATQHRFWFSLPCGLRGSSIWERFATPENTLPDAPVRRGPSEF